MIPIASGVRIWIATGHTDMRRGMHGLARQVQEGLGRDPFAGDVFVFRGRSGSLIKALWHDGIGLSLYAKRLDRGRFVWPQTVDGVVALTAGQMSYLLEAIDWRNPQHNSRCKPSRRRSRRLTRQGLLAPLVDQACRNLELARNSRHHRARRKRRRQNPPPLIVAPTTPTLRTRQQRYLGHAALLWVLIRTPYERRLTIRPSNRKAAFGGRIHTREPCSV